MKVFIISAIEWLVLQTDNDLDDKILAKIKSGMKLELVGSNSRGREISWLITMTEKFEMKWSPIDNQITNIIIPAMQGTAKQYAGYANELKWPPEFIALMLPDIANAFEENPPKVDSGCDCCWTFNDLGLKSNSYQHEFSL